jgi:hypothetical protein
LLPSFLLAPARMIRTSRVIGICSNAGLAAGFEHTLIASSHHPTHTATDHYFSDTPLAACHRPNDEKRLCADRNRFRQRGIRGFMR